MSRDLSNLRIQFEIIDTKKHWLPWKKHWCLIQASLCCEGTGAMYQQWDERWLRAGDTFCIKGGVLEVTE